MALQLKKEGKLDKEFSDIYKDILLRKDRKFVHLEDGKNLKLKAIDDVITEVKSPGKKNGQSVIMSTFSLVVICLGAGTITVPYLFYENGIFVGTLLLTFGAGLSLYTGYLIAYAAEMTGGKSYEEIA